MTANDQLEVQKKRFFGILSKDRYDIEKIQKAYEYAESLHEGQFRVSGEAYISHPLAVAEIVAELGLDTDSICAALLHDTVEDCSEKTDLEKIRKMFGNDVTLLVDGLTKIVIMQIEDKEEAHIESLRKMLLAMSKDIRVIFIKLCDRLHNMRTLGVKPDAKRRITALETMQVYAPLAHRLGMQKIKQELESLSLSYLDPIGFSEVKEDIEKKYGLNVNFIDNVRTTVENKLTENKIAFTLEGRIKSVYSIYKKMYNQNKSFDEIYDFYALRVIVESEVDCYMVLGLIHEMFKPLPGRFKDYISTPKPNMYRSLHTTVIGRDGIPFEVQIRTWEMHHIAEYGIAAHWKYKSGAHSKEDMDKKLAWVAKLVETENDTHDPDEFLNAIKTDIFHDEVFVFTPKGDVVQLPQGSTAIDFAYAIHSAVGHKMIGAKINGMIVPIDRILENGEIVEVITSQSGKGPSRDWLKIVKTSEARNKIRQWYKKEKRADNIVFGKGMIDGELKKSLRPYTEKQRDEATGVVSARFGYNTLDDFYNALGYGELTLTKVFPKIKDEFDKFFKDEIAEQKPQITEENIKLAPAKNLKSNSGIVVDGEKGCMVKFAKCCNPLPGDKVIGFITKGFGISIHKQDCPNVTENMKHEYDPARWVEAHWENSGDRQTDGVYEALLQIVSYDRIGLLADVSVALADMKVSILSVNTVKKGEEQVLINLKISCKNTEHYHSIVSRLKSLRDVVDVTRGYA
jgi:GTP pyrophosphokinase